MILTTTCRDDDGTETDLSGDSVEALAAQLPDDYAGPSLKVVDDHGITRGWIRSRTDWTAT